jgi:hypothetical protein
MRLTGHRILPVGRNEAWNALTDPETLRAAIPGCESFESSGEGQYAVVMTAALGPVRARFNGRVTLEDIVIAERYSLRFEGDGKVAGFARGTARVALQDEGTGTRLEYDAEALIGGRIAQVGSRLVDPAARKFVEQFFDAFCRLLDGKAEASAAPTDAAAPIG